MSNPLNDKEFQRLLHEAEHGTGQYKLVAIRKLGKLRDVRAVPALVGALNEEDHSVKWRAAKALGKIGEAHPECDWADAVSALIAALKGEWWMIKFAAVEALGKIGDPSAVPALLRGRLSGAKEIYEKSLEAIAKMGWPAAERMLEIIREEEYVQWGGSIIRTSSAVNDILAAMCPEILDQLIEQLGKENHEQARFALIGALGRSEDKRAVPVLIKELDSPDCLMEFSASCALADIRDARAVPKLIELITTKWGVQKDQHLKTLGEIGDPEAVSTLIKCINYEDIWCVGCGEPETEEEVRSAAITALGKIDYPNNSGELRKLRSAAREFRLRNREDLKAVKWDLRMLKETYEKWSGNLGNIATETVGKRLVRPKANKPERINRVQRATL